MKEKKSASINDLFILILLIEAFPFLLVWMSISSRLINDGVIWYNAIIGGYVWPFFVAELVYDDMLSKLLEMTQ